jgi:hypothetical protein
MEWTLWFAAVSTGPGNALEAASTTSDTLKRCLSIYCPGFPQPESAMLPKKGKAAMQRVSEILNETLFGRDERALEIDRRERFRRTSGE